MTINFLTLFPQMFSGFLSESITARAINKGIVDINVINIRDYSKDKHNRADDYPFGGGAGMVLMCQPVFDCFRDLHAKSSADKVFNIYMSPRGKTLNGELVRELAGYSELNILCGHYEGVDERIIENLIDVEVSVGDYVLTGGELPAMVVADCVLRYIPGVLGNEESAENESFSTGLLEYPQYTRPANYEGLEVPEVLLSGHHANICKWREASSIEITRSNRPDLYESFKNINKKI